MVPLPKKKATKKKTIVVTMKEDDEEGEKIEKNWADSAVSHLIALWREMELEFAKNEKIKIKTKIITLKGVLVYKWFHYILNEFIGLSKHGLVGK